MRLIEKVWFNGHNAKWCLVPLLLPLSLVFWLLSSLRRLGFRLGLSKAIKTKLPVVIVGNIGVGGNGKTPMVIHLIELCRQQGLTPGVISRGYGGQLPQDKHYPLALNQYTPVEQVGDEPYLIYHRCQVPVVVGPDRVASVEQLVLLGCDIVIADDGLQHYRLQRDCEIIVVDGKRGFGNGLLLPAGPLREGLWRLMTSQHIIVNGDNKIALNLPYQHMHLQASSMVNLQSGKSLSIDDFISQYQAVNAAAGIGDPSRFFDTLLRSGFDIKREKAFVDHHHFQANDFNEFDETLPLIMTEKDAVKCRGFAQKHWWYLAISAEFSDSDNQVLIKRINDVVGK